jgi:hypothetical protein
MTLASDGFTVELVWADDTLYLRRTDDVGSLPGDPPDGFGSASAAGWGAVDGPTCLTFGGGSHVFADVGGRGFSYGVVGGDITRIEVETDDAVRSPGSIGPTVRGGMRAWLAAHPYAEVTKVEGFNRAGQLVASAHDGATYGVSEDC